MLPRGEDDFELVVVDDGSTDRTWEVLGALSAADVRVRGVRLSRNFGHQSALMAGLAAARGHAVIMMDADLQHPPSLLPQLVRKWHEGFQVVHAVRRDPRTYRGSSARRRSSLPACSRS